MCERERVCERERERRERKKVEMREGVYRGMIRGKESTNVFSALCH